MNKLLDIDVDLPVAKRAWTPGERLYGLLWREGVPLGMVQCPDQYALDAAVTKARARPRPVPVATPIDLPLISVVICTRDRPQALARCLEAVYAQSYTRYEVLVVDNAPQDDRAHRLIAAHFPECRHVTEPRGGVRFARNRGISQVQGEIIAFLDDDCLPTPRWLSAIGEQFARRPRLGCVTGPVLPAELRTRAQELIEERGGFSKGFEEKLYVRDSLPKGELIQAWRFGTGANMAFRRGVFARVGGFDEHLRAGEDLEIFFRVLRHGCELAYAPAAAVRHHHVEDYATLRRKLYYWGWAYAAYLAKVAQQDPPYRRVALSELRNWLKFQLRHHFWGGGDHGDFPRDLSLAELAGAVMGALAYPYAQMRAGLRPQPASASAAP